MKITNLSRIKLHKKTVARIALVQVIYQYSVSLDSLETLLKNTLDLYNNGELNAEFEDITSIACIVKPSVSYLTKVVEAYSKNKEYIDSITNLTLQERSKKHYSNSNYMLTPILTLALIKSAICELLYFKDTPRKVVIDEYISISNEMLGVKDSSFVNFILDNIKINQ